MNNQIANNIAEQIHHMKPDRFIPGQDIGMSIEDEGLLVVVKPTDVQAMISYDEGADLYDVRVWKDGQGPEEIPGVFCDQLGEIIFGDEAKPWTMPYGPID